MKINEGFELREMCGEHIIIATGVANIDFSKVISLNESAAYLWREVEGKEFDTKMVAELLAEQYGIDMDIAERDAQRWIERLEECGLIE